MYGPRKCLPRPKARISFKPSPAASSFDQLALRSDVLKLSVVLMQVGAKSENLNFAGLVYEIS